MVVACIADDPRWDQLDRRDDYLARLVLALGIDIATIDELLQTYRSRTPEDERKRVPLLLEVLGRLSQLGNGDASAAMQREVAGGHFQAEAEEVLAYDDPPPASERTFREPDLSGATTEQLLATANAAQTWPVQRELRTRTSPGDVAAMLRASADAGCPMRAGAIMALAHQKRPELLPILLTFPKGAESRRVSSAMHRAFAELPFSVTRDAAIEWVRNGSLEQRRAATLAFARYASEADVPLVREMLAGELARGDGGYQYLVCDLAEALGRCPQAGPYVELRQAYREMVYSFGRRFVVEAMAATDPSFPNDLAIECLWDCNEQIREVGATHASSANPEAMQRIAALARDPHEDAHVRAAATSRL